MKSFSFRCGYMTGNRSRFSKYYMTGSLVFSINFTYQSIKNSQAILKCSIDLKSSLVYAGLRLKAPVVQTMDSAVHRINHYPADKH